MEGATESSEAQKVFKHAQHARLMKEEDETWISSEDLNTEESSDEEIRRRFKKKNRRHSRTKSASQLAKLVKPGLPTEQPSCKAEQAVLEEISKRTPNTDSSDVHETWKPIRGSLKFEDIEAGGPSGNQSRDLQRIDNFYSEMMYNVKHLKSSLGFLPPLSTLPLIQEEKTFGKLKNTPEVQEKLAFIKNFEEEIASTISQYKDERTKRLETEREMCKEISENKISCEKDAEDFLKLCEYDPRKETEHKSESCHKQDIFNFDMIEDDEKEQIINNSNLQSKSGRLKENVKHDFIKRNIRLAKEASGGVMSQFWLTDEEKLLQQQLLIDEGEAKETCITKFNIATPTSSLQLSDDEQMEMVGNDVEQDWPQSTTNAFACNESERHRLNEIDSELEKFISDDQPEQDQSKNVEETENDGKFWKQFNTKQTLKDINSKLDQLYQSFAEDEIKLEEISSRTQCLAEKLY